MYCIIYRFKVHESKNEQFIKSWSEVTSAFLNSCGSLGSRLHASGDREYIAYAQWPSRESFEAAELPISIKEGAFAEMRTCCEFSEALYKMTPVADFIQSIEFDNK